MEQNIMKKGMTIFLFLLGCSSIMAQQFFIPNQWWIQKPMLNPAASGTSGKLDAVMGSRLGGFRNAFEGSLTFGRVDGRIGAINSGWGVSYFNNNPEYLFVTDSNFVMRQRLAVNYNYQIQLGEHVLMSLGAVLDVHRVAWQLDFFGNGPNDPAIPPQAGPGHDVNIGFGVWFQGKNWQLGASSVPAINLIDEVNLNDPVNTLFIHASGRIPLDEDIDIAAEMLYANSQLTQIVNANLAVWIANAYYAGVGVTYQRNYPDSFDMMLGLSFMNRFRLHYVYSIGISELSNINANRHIISLQYRIPQ